MAFEQWDVVLATFPFSEDRRSKFRPVLVLSADHFNDEQDVVVAAMITTAARGRWSTDQDIVDLRAAGLRHDCVVRFKIATLARPLLDRRIGSLSGPDRERLAEAIRDVIPIAPKA